MTTSESDNKQKSELSEGLGNPAGRGGADSEMAATILYLAGPGGLFCNGEVIHPDVSFDVSRLLSIVESELTVIRRAETC